jgi:hypothetical protein
MEFIDASLDADSVARNANETPAARQERELRERREAVCASCVRMLNAMAYVERHTPLNATHFTEAGLRTWKAGVQAARVLCGEENANQALDATVKVVVLLVRNLEGKRGGTGALM